MVFNSFLNSSRRGVETTQCRGGNFTIFEVLTKKYSYGFNRIQSVDD